MKLLWAIGLWLGAGPALAAQDSMAAHWRALAEADSRAAISLIEENHPGAAPALGDEAFQQRLATARKHVGERLPKVSDHGGYAALMSGLAAEFGDGHIWSSALVGSQVRDWTGIVLARRGGAFVVGAQERSDGLPDMVGARLIGCDGVPAADWAKPRIGAFRGNPDIEAELASAAAWLLLDDGNPFLQRPAACTFQRDGEPSVEIKLEWRRAAMRQIEPIVARANDNASAGMGVSPFAGGHWIGLETLDGSAEAVVEKVRAEQAALRASPMVVIDLRGNGGGNSAYADAIAEALVGNERMEAADTPGSDCRGAFWRASAGNLKTLEEYRVRLAARGDAEVLAAHDALIAGMKAAIAAGGQFAPRLPPCASEAASGPQAGSATDLPPSAMRGRLVIVTDRSCFSSCLIAVDTFRRLGARHVGEATDMSTRYMEVREILLPSGLRTFSTLQKVALGLGDYGPYAPHDPYPGRLGDSDALKAWVGELR